MKVLLDVDGVVADFVPHLIRRVYISWESTGKPLRRKCDVMQWNFFDLLYKDDRRVAERELAKPEFWATLPLVRGAFKGVHALVREGHEVVWCTSPWNGCETWCETRMCWLDERFGCECGVIFTHDKSYKGGDVMIDDKAENVEAWLAKHPDGRGIVFKAPWNRHYKGERMNWKQITEELTGVKK